MYGNVWRCRACQRERIAKWREQNPNHVRGYMRDYMRSKRAREREQTDEPS